MYPEIPVPTGGSLLLHICSKSDLLRGVILRLWRRVPAGRVHCTRKSTSPQEAHFCCVYAAKVTSYGEGVYRGTMDTAAGTPREHGAKALG